MNVKPPTIGLGSLLKDRLSFCLHQWSQQEGGCLQARKWALTRNWICQHLDLGLPASRTVGNQSVAHDTLSTVFCRNSPCRLIHGWNATVTQANRQWPSMKHTCIKWTTGTYIPRYPGNVPTMDAPGSGADHALGPQRDLPRLHALCWSCHADSQLPPPSILTDLMQLWPWSNMPQA